MNTILASNNRRKLSQSLQYAGITVRIRSILILRLLFIESVQYKGHIAGRKIHTYVSPPNFVLENFNTMNALLGNIKVHQNHVEHE